MGGGLESMAITEVFGEFRTGRGKNYVEENPGNSPIILFCKLTFFSLHLDASLLKKASAPKLNFPLLPGVILSCRLSSEMLPAVVLYKKM